jgi:diphosphomevalonate decarboxylase
MLWQASAPSNIALIKYMGKESASGKNVAVNPSLSMTISAFRTTVEITKIAENGEDRWSLLPGSTPLREESARRFLDFFSRIKHEQEVTGSFLVRSGNNFPSDAGLASSASSFAALTMAACQAFADLRKQPPLPFEQQAMISRTGSGSSCRSFFSPWCAWEGQKIGPVPSKLPPLMDLVAVLDTGFKKISSSEAHKRVQASPLFAERPARAQQRMLALKEALAKGDYKKTAEISWAELWDMHSLFHTSEPPFFYLTPLSLSVLRWAEDRWEKTGHGPIATVDAGPNVHLLVPLDEKEIFRRELEALPGVKVLESPA